MDVSPAIDSATASRHAGDQPEEQRFRAAVLVAKLDLKVMDRFATSTESESGTGSMIPA